jgi:hypothetical protein
MVLVVGACGASTPKASGTASPNGSASLPDLGKLLQPGGTSSPGTPGTPAGGGTAYTPPPGPDTPGPSPSPETFDWTSTVPVQGTVTPGCVRRGGTARISVVTVPKGAVGYHAIYAGTKGGAPPPFGYGYGGDGRGFANGEGHYTDTWVVSPNAPVGPARVDVVVADGDNFGYDGPGFAVAGLDGTC